MVESLARLGRVQSRRPPMEKLSDGQFTTPRNFSSSPSKLSQPGLAQLLSFAWLKAAGTPHFGVPHVE